MAINTIHWGYILERAIDSTSLNFIQIAELNSNIRSYTDSSISVGTKYHYRVKATNPKIGDSSYSNIVNETTYSIPVPPPLTGSQTTLYADDAYLIYNFAGNFIDASGNNRDATGDLNSYVSGKLGNGIGLDSTGTNWVQTQAPALQAAWTFTFWYNPPVASDLLIPLWRPGDGIRINSQNTSGSNYELTFGTTAAGYTTFPSTFTAGNWEFMAVTFDGSDFIMYHNETGVYGSTGVTLSPGTGIQLANQAISTDNYDLFYYWDRALTTEELTYIYNGGSGRELWYNCSPYRKFHSHFDGNTNNLAISDSTSAVSVSVENNISYASAPETGFGQAVYFDGTSSNLFIPDTRVDSWDFRTEDFMIEMKLRFESISSGDYQMLCGNDGDFFIAYDETSGILEFNAGDPMGGVYYAPTWVATAGVNYHIAITRTSTTGRVFINGTQIGTDQNWNLDLNVDGGDGGGMGGSAPVDQFAIGDYVSYNQSFGGNNFKGWMWEYRIVKGFSYWSGDFDPNPTPYVD